MPSTRIAMIFLLLGLLVPAAFWVAAAAGSLSGGGELEARIITELRLPRAVAAFIIGGLLSLAGCLMQVLLRNPLADPYVLGVSGGAAFAALLGISLGLSGLPIPALAFLGALASMLLVFVVARGSGPWSTTRVLLSGVVVAAGWGALITLLLATGSDSSLKSMLYWLMGDLTYARLGWPWLLALAGLTGVLWLRARSLNVLAGGEVHAALLGESSRRLFWEIYVVGALLTALAVSIAGSIGFVGLIVPHLMRLIIGADHRRLLPAAMLFGGAFLVLADTAARTVIAPRQLPVGVLTALIGVPIFLFLLHRSARLR